VIQNSRFLLIFGRQTPRSEWRLIGQNVACAGSGCRLLDIHFDPSWADWLDRVFPRSRGVRRVEGAKLFFPEELPELIAEEARALWI
jgi:hypothetical protein